MRLADLQRALQSQVLARPSRIDSGVRANDDGDARARLGIYEHAYRARLSEALAISYPKVQRALGPERFDTLAMRFAVEHPSQFRSVRDYGEQLGRFLERRITGIKGKGIRELADFEWMLAAAFDGADCAPLELRDLASIAPEQWPHLTFGFAPTLLRYTTTSNAVQWWRAEDDRLPSRWRALSSTQWAISRRELAVFFRSLDRAEAEALDAARSGATFADVCDLLREQARARSGDTALKAARYLQQWVQDGWIVKVSAINATG